jgi:hypothetical protein
MNKKLLKQMEELGKSQCRTIRPLQRSVGYFAMDLHEANDDCKEDLREYDYYRAWDIITDSEETAACRTGKLFGLHAYRMNITGLVTEPEKVKCFEDALLKECNKQRAFKNLSLIENLHLYNNACSKYDPSAGFGRILIKNHLI